MSINIDFEKLAPAPAAVRAWAVEFVDEDDVTDERRFAGETYRDVNWAKLAKVLHRYASEVAERAFWSAVAREREACAMICDGIHTWETDVAAERIRDGEGDAP